MELPRHEQSAIEESLSAFPVVALLGARQVGKSTLARRVAAGPWGGTYRTLDDPLTREAIRADPDAYLAAHPGPLVLDEVQGAPDLLRAIKLRVDEARAPGQYLLTGSANLLAMPSVRETLAGRMALHELRPLSWSELQGRDRPEPTIDRLFRAASATEAAATLGHGCGLDALRSAVLTGGYPQPALSDSQRLRRRWFDSYVRTYVERDIPGIAGIEYLPVLKRLLRLLMLRTGNLLNLNDLGRSLAIPASTIRRYVDLLTTTYQVEMLQPYAGNAEKRIVKTPKVYALDSGLAAALTGADTWEDLERDGRTGPMFETWVLSELRKRIAVSTAPVAVSFWRTHQGREVDFVLERGTKAVALEVKAGVRVDRSDLAGLRALAAVRPLHLAAVVYGGGEARVFDERTLAIPAAALFA